MQISILRLLQQHKNTNLDMTSSLNVISILKISEDEDWREYNKKAIEKKKRKNPFMENQHFLTVSQEGYGQY